MALFDKLCVFISPSVKLLIVNSHAGLESLVKRRYRPQKHAVIPNGIDTKIFRFSEESRSKIRHELGVSINQPLAGLVARLNPMKDHPTFLKAAAIVAKEVIDIRFLCIGGGPNIYKERLHALTKELGLKDRVTWLGERSDIVLIYSALDILVSSSYGEGFSNVIGEAMSCGLPCVVTDVGDSARIVGDRSCVVEPRNPERLAHAICRTLQRKEARNQAELSRARIEAYFSLKRLIDLTEQNLSESNATD